MNKNYEGQHILNFEITNYKKIAKISWSLDGENLDIKGNNMEGKSSAIDALRRALGSTVAKKNKQPIRLGEEFAEVILELDNMIITWYLELDGKPKLKIMSKEGHYFRGPDAMLKELVHKMAYDPQAFTDLHPLEQKKIAIAMLDTGEHDIDDLDLQRQTAYDKRTATNRKAKEYQTLTYKCGVIDPTTPKEVISVSKLSEELTTAMTIEDQHNQDIIQLARNDNLLGQKQKMIDSLEAEIERVRQESMDLNTSISNFEDPHSANIKKQIDSAEGINEMIRNAQQKDKYSALQKEQEDLSKGFSTEIEQVDDTKKWILENTVLPVEGMGFDENGITINKIPLKDCSAAEQRELTMGIYFNTAPQGKDAIKIVFIEDGSLFDPESLEHIKKMCDQRGFQLIIEIVGTSQGDNQIIIEEGRIKS